MSDNDPTQKVAVPWWSNAQSNPTYMQETVTQIFTSPLKPAHLPSEKPSSSAFAKAAKPTVKSYYDLMKGAVTFQVQITLTENELCVAAHLKGYAQHVSLMAAEQLYRAIMGGTAPTPSAPLTQVKQVED